MIGFDSIVSFKAEMVTRILASVLLGFFIGIDRELTNKSAGLRTHILVSLGSTVFTILSIYGFANIESPDGMKFVNDPSRIAAQILTGIGFIGGGAVLHYGISVTGLTTAAALWLTASVGMAVGTGSYYIAFLTTVFTIMVLVIIRKVETGFLSPYIKKGTKIKAVILCPAEDVTDIQGWFYHEFENILELGIKKSARDDEENLVQITFLLEIPVADPINTAYKKLQELKNIQSLTLQQITDIG